MSKTTQEVLVETRNALLDLTCLVEELEWAIDEDEYWNDYSYYNEPTYVADLFSYDRASPEDVITSAVDDERARLVKLVSTLPTHELDGVTVISSKAVLMLLTGIELIAEPDYL